MASVVTVSAELAALLGECNVRYYKYPPQALYTNQLPASFVMPAATSNEAVSVCRNSGDTFTLSLVVAIKPAGQSTQLDNYNDLLEMIDTVNAALKTATFTGIIYHEWQIIPQDQRPIILDQTAFWGLTAVVTMHGG